VEAVGARAGDGIAHGVELHVDAEGAEPGAGQQMRMPPPSHREVDRGEIQCRGIRL